MLNAFDEEEAKKTDSSNPGLTRTQLVESMRRPFQALGYSAFCATIARHLHVLAGGKDARHGGIIESFRAVSADSTGSIQKEALARILPLGVAYLDEVSSAMCTSSDGLIRLEGFVNWAYADRGADERHRILIPKSGKLIAPSAVTGRRSASRGPGGEARSTSHNRIAAAPPPPQHRSSRSPAPAARAQAARPSRTPQPPPRRSVGGSGGGSGSGG
mmetsp:Transcript_93195/g.299990  ORF Transcript_93195/g.299990 Transcript_93195/m.299990 type:complete len:216 (-) Transcript_93195:57-704(-)